MVIMREKFQKLMKYKQLTSSRLAELLGVQASGISHILNKEGRKPSYELLQKILLRFPEINPDWLILESEEMFRPGFDPANGTLVNNQDQLQQSNTLFEDNEQAKVRNNTESFFEVTRQNQAATTEAALQNLNANSHHQNISEFGTNPSVVKQGVPTNRGNIKRIIILFEDRTFESYEMSK